MDDFKNDISLAAQGDTDAFARLYSEIYKDLYRVALSNLRSSEDAQDAVSEAVLDAFDSVKKLKSKEAFMSWFFSILFVKIKRRQREYMNAPECVDDKDIRTETDFESIEIKTALGKLDEDDRFVITMSALGGYKSEEIAQMCGLQSGSVRSKLSRARVRLLELLGPDENSGLV